MTAPMFSEKEYELNTEIEQVEEKQVFLRIEKVYNYNDVWEAKNAYEKFFSKSNKYDEGIDETSNSYYDKWINMIGDEECMIVKLVYVYQFESLLKAQMEEQREKEILAEIIEKNKFWRPIEDIEIDLPFSDGETIPSLSQEEILALNVKDLNLSTVAYNSLRRAGIITVEDLVAPKPEGWMGVRNLGRKSIEEVLDKIKKLGYKVEENNEDKKYPGREKCEQLRNIRIKIAELNDIEYEPAVCTHKGPCKGTCPVCDSEIKYLDSELQKKKQRGEEINITGIAEEDIISSQVAIPEDEEIIRMGAPIIDGGLEPINIIDEDNDFGDIKGALGDVW